MRVILVLGAVLLGVAVPAAPAHASVIWTGDAGRGSASATFGQANCDAPGSVVATTDPVHGPVWRFTKPAGDNRCEEHGIRVGGAMYRFTDNATYYLGWSTRLSSTVDDNAIFQWKSYGNHIQNYPVVLKVLNRKLTILNRQPGGEDHYPWAVPVSAGTWYHVVLGIHTSDALQGGWIELYLNGVPQRFGNGATRWPCRTWDSTNDPKWGVYGAQDSTVVNDVDDLRVGTAYPDVALVPARPSPSASRPASPSPAPGSSGPPAAGLPAADEPSAAALPASSGGHGDGPALLATGTVVLAASVAGVVVLRRRRRAMPRRPSHRSGFSART
jgi:polysaccharide lyase-like protein